MSGAVADDTRQTTGSTVAIEPAARLRGGAPRLPGDKSISHRALLLAALAEGTSTIRGAGDGADVRSTVRAVEALGAEVERTRELDGRVDFLVRSAGRGRFRQPASVIDCGNSGTTSRLLAGILAGVPVETVLDGDASLRARPMGRITKPLREMGASISGPGDAERLPLVVHGVAALRPIEHATPVPSAQLKSAILLAGLAAVGRTVVSEAVRTRDHTERMLGARGVMVTDEVLPEGHRVALAGPATILPRDDNVPADPSAAAFWLVAGAIHRDAEIRMHGVSSNPTRRAIIDLLRRMGADIDERPASASGTEDDEPQADLVVRSSRLRAIELSPADVAAAIDEIPVLCLAAAFAEGQTRIYGAGELRHKESDRIAGTVGGLSTLGARIRADGDDIVIDGTGELSGGSVDSLGDHRLAMTFGVAGLVGQNRTVVAAADSAGVSYPGFFADLEVVRQ